ncbi:thymidylate kinase [Zalerion maritima]|uniref:Thymidylate kinase n=1 Tax=Zalerion maritima TaxID=339359 RepID=A0AAD5WQ25_9PEZI|nr:thymidylate kinase [Zalerion maritima]
MASVGRQPFAPLDGARLQNLTSIKNRQNALTPNSSTKRKAALIEDADDFENLDPAQFSKRSKGLGSFFPNKEVYRSAIVLTNKASSGPSAATTTPLAATPTPAPTISATAASNLSHSTRAGAGSIVSPRRSLLNPKSPAKFGGAITKSSPLVPPGRSSPHRSKRSGLLNTRRRSGPYARIDPPRAASVPAPPFSLDAALKGTIPSYAARSGSSGKASSSSSSLSPLLPATTSSALASGRVRTPAKPDKLGGSSMKDSWFFDIHEDTHEQEMTNLLQHSTCVLDISSDEETETKRRREKDEGRDKENVPPTDDVSQTSTRLRRGVEVGVGSENENAMMVEEKIEARQALREMDVKAFFAEGCDERSVFVVPGDEDEDAETVVDEGEMMERRLEVEGGEGAEMKQTSDFVFSAPPPPPGVGAEAVPLPEAGLDELDFEIAVDEEVLKDVPSVEELMGHSAVEAGPKAAVLEPVEGTRMADVGESFELWESGSARDENEAPSTEAC